MAILQHHCQSQLDCRHHTNRQRHPKRSAPHRASRSLSLSDGNGLVSSTPGTAKTLAFARRTRPHRHTHCEQPVKTGCTPSRSRPPQMRLYSNRPAQREKCAQAGRRRSEFFCMVDPWFRHMVVIARAKAGSATNGTKSRALWGSIRELPTVSVGGTIMRHRYSTKTP